MKTAIGNFGRGAAVLKDKIFAFLFVFVLLTLGTSKNVKGEAATEALGQVVSALSGVLPVLGGILVAFGVVTIAIGVAQDSPADKQKGALSVVGGGLVIFAATLLP